MKKKQRYAKPKCESYAEMKAKEFKESVIKNLGWTNKKFKDSCFDYKTATCDGRCQSFCGCPSAMAFHQGTKQPKGDKFRAGFYQFLIECNEMQKTIDILKNDKFFMKAVKKICKDFQK